MRQKLRWYRFLAIALALCVAGLAYQLRPVAEIDYPFSQPLIDDRFHPAMTEAEAQAEIDALIIPVDWFWAAYNDLVLVDALQDEQKIIVMGRLNGRQIEASSYALTTGASCAWLIVPGSGHNQSSAIHQNDEGNYHHPVMQMAEPCDRYVFVKPNEDYLAIHNGSYKLHHYTYVNYMLHHGGSYSATYLIQAIAMAKYIQTKYDSLTIAGLSQGGFATLLISLQAEPDRAIVASGYTRLPLVPSGGDQIIIPDLGQVYTPEAIRQTMAKQKTQYEFYYGLAENGVYGHEARTFESCQPLIDLVNVTCRNHARGHRFPEVLLQ